MNEDIENFLEEKRQRISDTKTPEPEFQKKYEYAQLLVCIGSHLDSLIYFHEAFEEMKALSEDESPFWETVRNSCGAQYANTLDYLGQIEQAESVYKQLMAVDPTGIHIGDYALFLHRRVKDFDKAQSFYTKALQLYPKHSSIHLKYAGFLRHVKRDIAGAEEYYRKAMDSNPKNADAVGSYASFLHGVRNNITAAESLYKAAVEIDDTHTNNLCNYGLYLSEEKKDFEEAEKLYRRALEVNPVHTNTLYNYAVMLDTHLKRRPEAESFYRRALDCEARHSYALYNLAVLLEEKYFNQAQAEFIADNEQKLEVLDFYRRAVDADPRDATTLADYGRYLLLRMDDVTRAEPILKAALKLESENTVAMFNLAVLYHRHKANFTAGEALLRSLLEISPEHSAGELQLARLLCEKYHTRFVAKEVAAGVSGGDIAKIDSTGILQEGFDMYEKSILNSKEPASVIGEYLKVVNKCGNPRQKLHAVTTMSHMLTTLERSSNRKNTRIDLEGSQEANINPLLTAMQTLELMKEKIQFN